jgi:hypothetical protein
MRRRREDAKGVSLGANLSADHSSIRNQFIVETHMAELAARPYVRGREDA